MTNKLKGTKTMENLAKAFAGECQAGARYQFSSEKAEEEGYNALAQEFKVLAKNEMAHAKVFYNFITDECGKKIDDIKINAGYPFKCGKLSDELAYSAENERSESEKIYPAFAKTAKDEGFENIAEAFTLIANVENLHMTQLKQLSYLLGNDSLYKKEKPVKWKCSNCGHEETLDAAWQVCPLCRHPQGYVELPEE